MKNNKIVHDALILAAFSLVLGFVLGGVYKLTKPAIDLANLKKEQAALFDVFEDAHIFEDVEYDADAANKLLKEAGYKDSIEAVKSAVDADGNVLGYVVNVKAIGSQGAITMLVGVRVDGTVNGYSILEHSETKDMGSKAAEEEFMSQFRNKKVDKFVVVKTTPTADNEIEAIATATITSNAVANACNAAMVYVNSLVGGAK